MHDNEEAGGTAFMLGQISAKLDAFLRAHSVHQTAVEKEHARINGTLDAHDSRIKTLETQHWKIAAIVGLFPAVLAVIGLWLTYKGG